MITKRKKIMQNAPNTITVFSLNLRFGLADDGINCWEYRKKSIELLVNQYASDFMAFQEANDFQTEFIEGVMDSYRFIGQRKPAPDFWQNNILFYHRTWACRKAEHFFLSRTPDIPSRFNKSRWPRQCTIGLFERGGFSVICVNTHLDFEDSVQEQSARLILSRLGRFPQNAPVILVGDFNTTPDSSCFRVLTGKRKVEGPGHHMFRSAFIPPYSGTFHKFSGNPDGRHIDWVLWKGELEVVDARVIRDKFDNRYPSDHFPVIARFTHSA
jgi:endonuclease/exonuclease/phosphatase family metal-dependent hydrolase